MTLLQARTTKVSLCVVVLFVASGFASITNIPVDNPSFEMLPDGGLSLGGCGHGCHFSMNVPIPDWGVSGSTLFGQFQPVDTGWKSFILRYAFNRPQRH